FDGDDLQFRNVAVHYVGNAHGCGFAPHFSSWRMETNEQPKFGLFTVKYASKRAHVIWSGIPSFDGRKHTSPWPARPVWEEQFTVDTPIRALFLLPQSVRIEQIICPPLKLIFVALSQAQRRLKIARHSFAI